MLTIHPFTKFAAQLLAVPMASPATSDTSIRDSVLVYSQASVDKINHHTCNFVEDDKVAVRD